MGKAVNTTKNVNIELNEITFEKLRNLLNKYRVMYGLQTYDDLINFLIENQAKILS
ncbi:MAG: hypothetical protein N3E38_02775 [Candidatus Aenigmarchaeota archaeon]|nr:hypothetical protein [Candidatus Aenigmarchaeota archaeon]